METLIYIPHMNRITELKNKLISGEKQKGANNWKSAKNRTVYLFVLFLSKEELPFRGHNESTNYIIRAS